MAETRGAKDVGDAQPTPTQEENDLAIMGEHVHVKESDGSPLDAKANPPGGSTEPEQPAKKKQMEARPAAGGGYQTRQTTARPVVPEPSPQRLPSSE
jgi:hypothetical protein